jgi:2-haloacid dehalogenase
MKPVIVFDVNETLLDLAPVREWFTSRFGDEPSASMWFGELLRLSFVSAATNRYIPFPELGAAALASSAERHGASIGDGDIEHIGGVFTTLPAHPDVAEGLDTLRRSGFTIVALTNSPLATAETQLANAHLANQFDRIMSVEMVDRFKPHRSVYEAAASALGVPTSALAMVAAHDWDIAGAMLAGCDGVFISRPGQIYSPSFDPPTLRARDITDAARQIVATHS